MFTADPYFGTSGQVLAEAESPNLLGEYRKDFERLVAVGDRLTFRNFIENFFKDYLSLCELILARKIERSELQAPS